MTKADGQVVIHVVGSDLPKPTQVSLWKKGTAYTLEWAAGLATSGGRVRVDSPDVSSVWYGWFSSRPRKVRLQVHTRHNAEPVLTRASDGWTLTFGDEKVAATSKPAKSNYMADMPVESPHHAVAIAGTSKGAYASPDKLQASIQAPNGAKWNVTEDTEAAQKIAPRQKTAASKQQGVQLMAATTYVPHPQGKRVSVDCTNADLAQVLKGLAMQSGANIVIGPDVKGKVTADLHNVPIEDALGYMSYLTGVKFKKENGVYMFGSAPESEHPAVIQPPAEPMPSMVKVVPILSDSEMEVKEAIETRFKGKDLQVLTPQQAQRSQGLDRMSHDMSTQNPTALPSPGDPSKSLVIPESYLILVGAQDIVMEADRITREVDDEIVKAHSSYEQVSRVDRTMMVYDVKFADPRALRENLITEVPGLRVTMFPNAAGASIEYTEGRAKTQANEDNTLNQSISSNQNNQSNQQTQGGGAEGSVSAVSTQEVSDGSLEQPFSKEEKASVPMRLVLRGSRGQIGQALDYLKMLDIAPKQVALELRVMELTKEDALKAGIDWNIFTGGAVKIVNLNNSQALPNNQVGIHISGNNWGADVGASLDQLVSANKLLARPNIVAMDGRQSEIFVGDIIRYVQSITNSQNGISVTTGEVPTGVRLSVLPRVGGDGNLTLELRPRISLLTSFTTVPGGGQLPQTSTRFAQSTINMKSGQTLAIGGLIQDQDVKTYSGIPFLMNLPLIGNLFKSTNLTRNRTELVIFLTARAIDGPVEAERTPLPLQDDIHIGEGH
ncbi:MAG TPA: hypothetical protein VG944_23525 [Fimbriimonas sp.]|nr:hypothetical protein [Fimbriimonas sp.]